MTRTWVTRRRPFPTFRSIHFLISSFFLFHESESEDEEDAEDETDPSNSTDDTDDDNDTVDEDEDEGPEGRNEFLNAFPPARTPELYAVINSRVPMDSEEVNAYVPKGFSPQGEFGPVVAYRIKQKTQQQQRPSVSVAVALVGGGNAGTPQKQKYVRNPYISQQVRNPYIAQFIRKPVSPMRRNPYTGPYAQHPYVKQQIRSPMMPMPHQIPMPSPYVNQYFPNAYINRFVNRPPFNPYEFRGPPSQGLRLEGNQNVFSKLNLVL